MDVTAAVAYHEPDLQNTAGGTGGDTWCVQVDHHAARTVRTYRVGAGFLPYRREIGLACCPETVAPVIALCEIALAALLSAGSAIATPIISLRSQLFIFDSLRLKELPTIDGGDG